MELMKHNENMVYSINTEVIEGTRAPLNRSFHAYCKD